MREAAARRSALALGLIAAIITVLVGATSEADAARYEFREVTRRSGLVERPELSWGSTWTDYDDNGYPDLLVNHHWHAAQLYKNAGGDYRLLGEDFYPYQVDRHGCAWGEANGDGRLDLYCTQGADRGRGSGPNQLMVQTDRGFVDRARRYGVRNTLGRGRSVNWIDYDSDGDLDLFVGNHFRRGHPNVMFENVRGGFKHARVGLAAELETLNSTWADWDVDGDPDLLVLQHRRKRTFAYRNDDGRFVETVIPGVTDTYWKSAAWGDYDGDGFSDLHLVRPQNARLFHNSSGTFELVDGRKLNRGRMSAWLDVDNDGDLDLFVVQGATGPTPRQGSANYPDFLVVNSDGLFDKHSDRSYRGPRAGNGDAVAVADHDRDGLVDLFVTNGHNPSTWTGTSDLLENRSRAANWVEVELEGTAANPWGFGTRITVEAPPLLYRREITDGFNYRTQSEVGLVHLGIGSASEAMIRVEWPRGTPDCVSVRAGKVRTVRKGAHPCPVP